jgi:DNA polymerase I-like protein with 3'-5' exonuclease and polymerase domains/uracil-DNA glycosylase
MSFFYNETKSGAGKAGAGRARTSAHKTIPIETLRQMGCSACALDKAPNLNSPKLAPSGRKSPLIYLLGSSPTSSDDNQNNHWTDAQGEAVRKAFGEGYMRDSVRSGYITQCMGEQTKAATECCRGRVEADIEGSQPLVLVTVGEAALQWALGSSTNGNTRAHRGTLFVCKFGAHTCYLLPLADPNWVGRKSYGSKSEHQLAFEHDVKVAKLAAEGREPAPKFFAAPYDSGVVLITGREPNDMERLEAAFRELAQLPRLAIDIETNALRPFAVPNPSIWSVAVGTSKRVFCFPLDHPEGWGTEGRKSRVWALLGEFLLHSGRKAAHNLAFELEWFHFFYGPDLLFRTEWDDTMAMAHTFDSRGSTKSLDIQTRMHFGFFLKSQSRVDPVRFLEYPLKEALRYNALDTKWTDELRQHLQEKLEDGTPEYRSEYERKLRLAPTLITTEYQGLPISFTEAEKQEKAFTASASAIEAKILRTPEVVKYRQRFGTFSPTNPDHTLKLLKDICKRPEIRVEDARDKTVRWTTEEEVLALIPGDEVPSVPLILEHRTLAKVLSTYITPIASGKNVCSDGRVRSKYSSMIAITGRLAAEDPAIQNWPKRKNKQVRAMVAAPPGQLFLAADYGQLEFRVAGMASEDTNLVKYCWTGYDVHKDWAHRIVAIYPKVKDVIVRDFGVDWDELGLETLRQEAKNKWVFPQIFGASTRSCAGQLQIPEDVAEDLGAEFWDEFPGVKRWQDKVISNYQKNLYVETLGGRKRRGPMTKNELINHPIQGSGADIVTAAQVALSERAYLESNAQIQPVLNVHDDLTFLMQDTLLEPNLDVISIEMCKHRFDYIIVPLVVEASIGFNWADLKKIKVYRSDALFNLPNPYM